MESPRVAWDRMIDLLGPGGNDVTMRRPEDFIALLDPFLANPEQHGEHVKLIIEASELSRTWRLIETLSDLSGFFVPAFGLGGQWIKRRILKRMANKRLADFEAKVVALGNTLREEALPGEYDVYVLPAEALSPELVPRGWTGLKAYEVEMRLALDPEDGLLPERVSLHVELPKDGGAFFVSQTPESSNELVGYTRATGRKVTDSSKDLTKAGLSKVVAVEMSREKASARESSTSEEISIQSSQPRVVASLRPVVASWDLYDTPGQKLVGGFKFRARFAVPEAYTQIAWKLTSRILVTGWGPAEVRVTQNLLLPAA